MSDCALSFFSFPCFIAFFISHAKQRLVIGYRLHLFFVSGMTGSLIGFCMLRYILLFRVLLTPFFNSHAKQRLVIEYRLHLFFVSVMTRLHIGFCMLLRYILKFNVF